MYTHLAQRVEYGVEIDQNFSLGDLGDVIHALAGKVPNSTLLIGEALDEGVHEFVHVLGHMGAKRNCGGSETDETAVASVKSIGRGGKELNELVNYYVDAEDVALTVAFANKSGQDRDEFTAAADEGKVRTNFSKSRAPALRFS